MNQPYPTASVPRVIFASVPELVVLATAAPERLEKVKFSPVSVNNAKSEVARNQETWAS